MGQPVEVGHIEKTKTLSYREKLGLAVMFVVIIWAWSIVTDWYDPQRKYYSNEKYCENDFDCVMVLDSLTNSCMSVNIVHKTKYDWDSQCRRRLFSCSYKRCIAP